jgi:hypothetical protein
MYHNIFEIEIIFQVSLLLNNQLKKNMKIYLKKRIVCEFLILNCEFSK